MYVPAQAVEVIQAEFAELALLPAGVLVYVPAESAGVKLPESAELSAEYVPAEAVEVIQAEFAELALPPAEVSPSQNAVWHSALCLKIPETPILRSESLSRFFRPSQTAQSTAELSTSPATPHRSSA